MNHLLAFVGEVRCRPIPRFPAQSFNHLLFILSYGLFTMNRSSRGDGVIPWLEGIGVGKVEELG